MVSLLKKVWMGEEGASMVEYGLLVALIAVVAMVGAGVLGTKVNAKFDSAAGKL